MYAVITGASSGIGRDIATVLSEKGYDLVLVSRREERLKILSSTLKTNCIILPLDLSKKDSCFTLFEKTKDLDIDILVNGAGFGVFGDFSKTELSTEIKLIDVNITALHILTKLYLNKFREKGRGYILNISSSAGFMAGPLFSSYYASKNYVLRLSQAIFEEQQHNNSGVIVSALCPGPVNTEFNNVANVSFSVKPLSSRFVAEYAVSKLLKGKSIIIPGIGMKFTIFLSRFIPESLRRKITYKVQKAKKL